MSEKITITDEDLSVSAESKQESPREKIVFCELSSAAESESKLSKDIPLYWYIVLLLPVISVIAVIWGCFQKKYRFAYQLPAAIICLLSTLLPLLLFTGDDAKGTNWKNVMAQRAQHGVVIVVIEDKKWYKTSTGFGTGVVVSKQGDHALILTNRHVVCKKNGKLANTITILTAMEKVLPTEVVALPVDPNIDMALLCVKKASSLDVLGDIGRYDSLNTGDEVVAIGHPNGFSFTMTQGIVSALREGLLIQSSASINPGNSGGPLLDSNGRIIGINTFFIKDTQGLNFAFRADYILRKNAWKYSRNIDHLLNKISLK